MIKIQGLSKSYLQGKTEIQVLRNCTMELTRGKTAAILGKSGSGKSTLLSLLAGLDRPQQGEIYFEHRALGSLSEADVVEMRGRQIGLIFQQFHLIPGLTAFENVILPLDIHRIGTSQERKITTENALEKVGLAHRRGHFPHQMSGGENQRVAIARAIATNPHLILADEPSGSLDDETGEQVMGMLFELVKREGRAMILVTHSLDLAKKCDEIYTLKSGELFKQ